jgi:uncharacterized protein (TIGR02266 family)
MRGVVPLSNLTNRVANERGSVDGSHTNEQSGMRSARAQQSATSGYCLSTRHPVESEERPTLAGSDALAERLDLAIRELDHKEERIRILEQELETLKSGQPTQVESESPPRASPPSETHDEAVACLARDVSATDPSGGGVQWHRVTVAASPSLRPSLAPTSQRRAERRLAELQVEFDSETQFYAGITQDISEGGVFIATYCIQPVGTALGLSFELPCGTKVETRGTVRWLRDPSHNARPGMGVAFDELSADSLAAIGRFCSQHVPLYVEV